MNVTLTLDDFKEIASMLDFGVRVFINKETGKILEFTHDEDDDEDEGWMDFKKVQSQYFEVKPPSMQERIALIRSFVTSSKVDEETSKKLAAVTDGVQLVARFRDELDWSEALRFEWFKFKSESNTRRVEKIFASI